MTKRSSTYLKGISETGDIANQTLFEDLIDSMGVVDSGTTFDDSGTITVDGTVEYSTIRTVTGSTHTLTAATSGNVSGNYKKVRYTFDVDCTLTLTNFDETGSTLGTVNPIQAGTYDFWFFTTPFGLALLIQNNTGTTPGTLSTPTLVLSVGNGAAGYVITSIDSNATAGVLEYSTDNVNWTTWGSYSFGTETGTITGLTNGVLYYGRYRNSATGYNPSGYATDTVTPSSGTTQLTQPTGLTATPGNGLMQLDFDPISINADNVDVQRSISSGSGFTTIETISRSLIQYIDYTPANDIPYFYRLIANGSGSYTNSDPSAEATDTPSATGTGIASNTKSITFNNTYFADITDDRQNFTDKKFSIEVWFKIDTLKSNNELVARANRTTNAIGGWNLRVNGVGSLFFRIWKDLSNLITAQFTTSISAGTWYHVVCTYNGDGTANAYLNNVSASGVETGTMDGMAFPSGCKTIIGGWLTTDQLAEAKIDFIRMYNKELGASEVSELYNSGSGKILSTFSSKGHCIYEYGFNDNLNDTVGASNASTTGTAVYSTDKVL